MKPTIPEGDLYDCRDSEELFCGSPEEALEEYIDIFLTKDCDVSAVIREYAPIKVTAWNRMEVGDDWVKRIAERAQEEAAEAFAEEFGDPNGDAVDAIGDGVLTRTAPLFEAAVRALVSEGSVWGCERAGEVMLSAEEVEALLREHCPEWFTEAA